MTPRMADPAAMAPRVARTVGNHLSMLGIRASTPASTRSTRPAITAMFMVWVEEDWPMRKIPRILLASAEKGSSAPISPVMTSWKLPSALRALSMLSRPRPASSMETFRFSAAASAGEPVTVSGTEMEYTGSSMTSADRRASTAQSRRHCFSDRSEGAFL